VILKDFFLSSFLIQLYKKFSRRWGWETSPSKLTTGIVPFFDYGGVPVTR
jgi:hypothetical protein